MKHHFSSLYLAAALSFGLAACSDDAPAASGQPDPDPVPENSVERTVTVDAGQVFQTIDGFAASDCWSPNYVGRTWTKSREGITELLFSSEIINGQPQGIGLSQWRVNLGGGTAQQGDASDITDKSRRAESYLNDDLSYDWSRCEGQRYFMQRADELGCENFILFSNTPPVQYTINGKGYSNQGGTSNLKPEHYGDFAAYMAEVAAHYENEGYHISHISPVNEPQYDWGDPSQEGSGWTNDEIAALARELDAALSGQGLSTEILLGEAGDWEYLYQVKNDAKRSDVINAFFTPGSSAYVGDLAHVRSLIGGHSYWTDGTWDGMRDVRERVARAAASNNLRVWQTEWSMLGDNYSSTEFGTYDAATEMDIALYMSRVIYNDLTVANVSSWSYWTSMDVSRWGHKNRFLLISLVPAGGVDGDIEQEGSYQATATLWVLGNYSLFIRPGYQRIALNQTESMYFFGSAYLSPDKKRIVAVYTNYSDRPVRLAETRTSWPGEPQTITTYTTTLNKHLQEATVAAGNPVVVEAESVTTVVYDL